MRSIRFGAALGASLAGVLMAATAVQASGLEGLHKHVQVGNKVCMAGHFHYGQTAGWATRAQAEASAAESWGSFTRLEYGQEWADFRLAAEAAMDCQESASDRGGTVWSCKSKAKPCKLAHPVAAQMAPPRYIAQPQRHAYVPAPRVVHAPAPSHHSEPVTIAIHAPQARHWHGPHCRHAVARPPMVSHPVGHHGMARSVHGHGRPLVWPGDAR
ncbi:MAG: hypothetical protein ACKVP7_23405 [Hyphomicrobiaceae bacterium]